MLITYAYGWLPVYPPTARLSVCPPDCSLLFFRQLSFIVSTADCPSVCPSLSLSTPVFLNIPRRFDRRLPVYPPDRPSVCLSVCLSACPLLFFRQLSIAVSTAGCVSIHRLFVTIFDADCPPGQGVADAGRGGRQ